MTDHLKKNVKLSVSSAAR